MMVMKGGWEKKRRVKLDPLCPIRNEPIEYDMDRIESSLTEVDLEVMRDQNNILSEVRMRLPKSGERPSNPLEGMVAMCTEFFYYRMRLPI